MRVLMRSNFPFLVLGHRLFKFEFEGKEVLLYRAQRGFQFVRDNRSELFAQQFLFPAQGNCLQHQPAALDTAACDQAELVRRERLGQEVVGALLHRIHSGTDRGKAGNDHHDDGGVEGVDFFKHFQAGDAGHFQVDKHQVGLELLDQLQAEGAIGGGLNLKLAAFQDLKAGVQNDFLIIND